MANRYSSKKLNQLFVSETRVKILAYSFLKPGEPFHLRKVARSTESSVNSVSRELKRLEQVGFLFSKKTPQKKLFYINTDFKLLRELQAMIHKELGLGGQILSLLPNLGNASMIVLTSIFLEGGVSSPEDLDLLIVGNPDVRMVKVCVENAQDLIEKEINYMIIPDVTYTEKYRRRDETLVKALGDNGLVLWKREGFV